jgi:glucose-6-phosphate 1-dehydrogenase
VHCHLDDFIFYFAFKQKAYLYEVKLYNDLVMEPFALVIFGVSGNLAQLKLIPALYDLEDKKLLPEGTIIAGMARKDWTREQYHNYVREVLATENHHHQHEIKSEVVNSLLIKMHYLKGDFEAGQGYEQLKKFLSGTGRAGQNHLYYLATYPQFYGQIFNSLQEYGMNKQDKGWVRLMIEKPIGHDAASARELDAVLHKYFTEEQIYRLDHYLGKETIQNILVFRFGNGLLQPLLNREYIDHIQITAAEDFGVGKRGGYYDNVGALRDVGQNHLLQMLVVATMDAPAKFANREVTDERIKILKKIKANPKDVIFGQYNGYRYEEKIKPDSTTDTFFALKTEVDNDQWRGVPVYIRAGKKMAQTVTEISLVFKTPENSLFHNHELGDRPNVLTYRIQPHEGIGLSILVKKPGHKLQLENDFLQYYYKYRENELPDAYEKLIFDAIAGDPTFFNDAPEVIAAWEFVDKLMPFRKTPEVYDPGSWGPAGANQLIEADGRKWLEPSLDLCSE